MPVVGRGALTARLVVLGVVLCVTSPVVGGLLPMNGTDAAMAEVGRTRVAMEDADNLDVPASAHSQRGQELAEEVTVALPEMEEIPGGIVRMGTLNGKTGRIRVSPEHNVTISPFRLSKYEVTFVQWDACVADGGCSGYWPDDAGWGRDKRPVINVSWDDAQAYISWLNTRTGDDYRLPTEAEWEYAARAGSKMEYHFGGDVSALCSYANHADRSTDYDWRNNTCSDGVGTGTAEVGQYLSNQFGLHDMYGNVWEWVEDCWHRFYLGATLSDGTHITDGDCSQRVRRGGSWGNLPLHLRSMYRSRLPRSYRHNHVGFRLAQDM